MKRYFGGLITLLVLALMLAACGDSPTAVPAATSSTGSNPTSSTGTGTTSGTDTVPGYTGATSIAAPSVFAQSYESSYTKSIGGTGFKFNYYATTDTAANVLAYYDTAVTKAGYTKVTSQDLPATSLGSTSLTGKTTVYSQTSGTNAGVYQVVVFGPFDDTTSQAIGGVKSGQSLIITSSGSVSTSGGTPTP